MNSAILIAAVVAVFAAAEATDLITGTGALFTGTGGTHLVLASGAAGTVGAVAAVGGAAILLKAAALFLLSQSRSKRSTDNEIDLAFVTIAAAEPQACVRRLICDLAAGSEDNIILSLFNRETPADSPKFDFAIAAALGKQLKNVQACELRYSCQIESDQLQKLF